MESTSPAPTAARPRCQTAPRTARCLISSTLTSSALTPWGRKCSMVLGTDAHGHPPFVTALDNGEVRVTHHSERPVDAWFGGSAADLLLAGYGRLGTLASLRTLRLRGRRPYRGLLSFRAFESV